MPEQQRLPLCRVLGSRHVFFPDGCVLSGFQTQQHKTVSWKWNAAVIKQLDSRYLLCNDDTIGSGVHILVNNRHL